MNHWCESCARKNLCYVVDDRPKCFVPITNTAPQTCDDCIWSVCNYNKVFEDDPQTERKSE